MILKIKNINYDFVCDGGEIYNLKIENPHFLLDLLKDFKSLNDEAILVYENVLVDISKCILFLGNPLDLDLNIKKQLTTLYADLDKNAINDEKRIKLAKIIELINELLLDVTLDYDAALDFDSDINFKDLFEMAKVRYHEDDTDYLNNFCYFIRAMRSISKYRIIVTYSMLNLLTAEEIIMMKKELELYHFTLIDIGNNDNKEAKTIIIDKDLCEIY